jgi:8-oxo-dGTP pyrophosphatase MutT (NUDIX family)
VAAQRQEGDEISRDAKGRIQWGRRAAGFLFRREDGRVLLTLRSDEVLDPEVWGIPGGRVEPGEILEKTAILEATEELGSIPAYVILSKDVYRSGDFEYTTFLAGISDHDAEAWEPALNWENTDWGWYSISNLPRPMHPNVQRVIDIWQSQLVPSNVLDELIDRIRKIPNSIIYHDIRYDDTWKERLFEARETDKRATKTRLIHDWIGDRWDDFLHDLQEAEAISGRLVVYRCISVKSPQAFADMLSRGDFSPKYPGLGIYWSWDPEKAECHWRGQGSDVFLRGLVDLEAIDIKGTVLSNFAPSTGQEELEIRLWDGKFVELLGIGIERETGSVDWRNLKPSVTMKS